MSEQVNQTTQVQTPPDSERGKTIPLSQFVLSIVLPPVGLFIIYNLVKKRPIKWLSILGLIIAILIGTAVYFELNNLRLNNSGQNQNKYQYSSSTQSFTWVGNANGTFGFDKPSEFKETFRKADQTGTDTAIYTHKSSKGYAIGFIGLSVSDGSKLAQDQTYIDGVKYLMTHPTGDNYDKYTGYFTGFVSGFLGSDYHVQLSSPQSFTNKSIKDKAWIFDLSATAPNDKKLAPLQGKFVYIINGKNFHDFSVLTTKDDWQPNSSAWSQMLDSLKVY